MRPTKGDGTGVTQRSASGQQELPHALRTQLLDIAASWQALADQAARNRVVYEMPPLPTGKRPLLEQQQQQIQPRSG